MTQTMSTQDLKMTRRIMWVQWDGTQCRVNNITPHLEDGGVMVVNLTRFNMCGTEIGRLNVEAANNEPWTVIEDPNKRLYPVRDTSSGW